MARHSVGARGRSLARWAAVAAGLGLASVRVHAQTATINEFTLPPLVRPEGSIAAGPDGNLWFTIGSGLGSIGRITTAGVVTEFPLPTALSFPSGISAGPDGNLWFAESHANKVGRMTPSGIATEFPLPGNWSRPIEIAAGPDGNLWVTEADVDKIGRITTDGVLTEFSVPTPDCGLWGITAGPDGNLWFTESDANKIGRITPSGVITEFALPAATTSLPAHITSGPDGNLWFTEVHPGANKIGRITPSGVVSEFPIPSARAYPRGITAGPDANLWFTESGGNRIGQLVLRPAKGDFDGDGQPDLLFRSVADGTRNKVWLMNGTTRRGEAVITPDAASSDWLIRGTDDFDSAASPGAGRDFENDLVFWNQATGAVQFWLMNGTSRPGAPVPLTGGAVLPVDWDLAATGDFNRDGRPDLVWRNVTSQKIEIWTMNGTAKTGAIVPTPDQAVSGNWAIVAAADYDGHGDTDLLWYNSTSGKVVTWYMDAAVSRLSGQFTTPDSAANANWAVVASADYSAGSVPATPPVGSPDIAWRNRTSGKQVVWHLDFKSTRVHGEFTSPEANTPALDWTLVGPR